jgi:hypothetical protein
LHQCDELFAILHLALATALPFANKAPGHAADNGEGLSPGRTGSVRHGNALAVNPRIDRYVTALERRTN